MISAVKIRRAVNEKESGFVGHGEPAVCMKIMYGL